MSYPSASIGDVATIITGKTPSTEDETNFGGDIPFVTPAELDLNGQIFETPRTLSERGASKMKLVPKNSILVCCIGSLGKIGIAGKPLATNQQINAVVFDELKVSPRFGYYALKLLKPKMEAMAPATTVKIISKSKFSELYMPLPPLEEQKRIAAILDQADALRRLRQRAIDRLNTLGQAIFHEMFGDPKVNPKGLPWVKLSNVADFYSGNSLPEGEPFSEQHNGHLLLKVSDLNHPRNSQDIVCAASWSASPGSRAGTCPPDALIFPKRGGAIGTNKKRWLKRSAILDPNLMGVYPDSKQLTMAFLNGWFQTFNLSDIASGSSVPQLNKQDLAPLEIALPPVEAQAEYARRMESLACIRKSASVAASHDDALFRVLQHKAFQGEL